MARANGLALSNVHLDHNTAVMAEGAALAPWSAFTIIAQKNNGDPADPADFTLRDVVHEDSTCDRIVDGQAVASILIADGFVSRRNTYLGRADGEGAIGMTIQPRRECSSPTRRSATSSCSASP